MLVKIKFGCQEITREYATAPSVGEVKRDNNLRAILGHGDNVRALINGVEQPDGVSVPEAVTVTLETAANTKG